MLGNDQWRRQSVSAFLAWHRWARHVRHWRAAASPLLSSSVRSGLSASRVSLLSGRVGPTHSFASVQVCVPCGGRLRLLNTVLQDLVVHMSQELRQSVVQSPSQARMPAASFCRTPDSLSFSRSRREKTKEQGKDYC